VAKKEFGFDLKQKVKLVESNETGEIIGRAEYTESMNAYLVRYRAGDGRQSEAWWTEAAIEAA
jgi:hypothetical protein